jgi:4,5-DOPA dioxygenase extradiol
MTRLPTLFVSHGAPTFAIEPGLAGPLLTALGRELPRPKAILLVSPHWMTRGLAVGSHPAPPTIHDFSGFPPQLYTLQYPATGDPALAARVIALLASRGLSAAQAAPTRGLDHGAWVPLSYLYPQADVPVVPLSLPIEFDAAAAWALGAALAPLSEEGVLIVGSGSLTHNLSEVQWAPGTPVAEHVRQFVDWTRQAARHGDRGALLSNYLTQAPHAQRAHPTPEHYLPLPFAAGAARPGAAVRVLDGGITHGVLSMDAFVFD